MIFRRIAFMFAQIAVAAFFVPSSQPRDEASELDLYLFDRESRMDEAWESDGDRSYPEEL
jgi:hypothetical protein